MNARTLALPALAGLVVLPQIASANVAAVCTDRTVTVGLERFWTGPVALDDLTVSVGGSVIRTGPYAFNGPTGSLTLTAPTTGPLVATARHRGSVWTSPAAACAPVVVTAPVPPVAEQNPPVVAAPPVVVKEGGTKKETKTTKRLISTRSERVLRAIACKRVGDRGFAIVRISVVWKRDGEVVKTRTAVVRRPGPVCRTPAVTG
jgi:hypothetical protein